MSRIFSCVFVLCLIAASVGGARPATAASAFPARFTAPYVETWTGVSLINLATKSGQKFFTLAFIMAYGGCIPTWNEDQVMGDAYYITEIRRLRGLGGDVIISFGGASGAELAQACNSVATLQAAYQKVIDTYKVKRIDLDIESDAVSDAVTVDRRNKALAKLQAANPTLKVSYSLAVDPSGLPEDEFNLIKNAKKNHVRVDVVNIMVMDYDTHLNGNMATYAIQSAKATKKQLNALGFSATTLGLCPMIGQNDVRGEIFTLDNAATVQRWAQGTGYISQLTFWAINRDNGKCPGNRTASDSCSGLTQKTYDFTKIFKLFK